MNWIRHRPLAGKLKETIIKQENNHWYAICVCEITPSSPISECHIDEVLGIDLGLESLLICSDNTTYDNPRTYTKYQNKLRKQQRILSRRKKGSVNRNKARQLLAKIHTKIHQVRNDHLHKITSSIIKRCAVVGLEDLNIKGMTRTRLAKSIYDASWGYIKSMLEYKMRNKGGEVRYIDQFYASTQTCSCCGNRRKIRLDERIYTCDFCGSSMSRDLNAALNIKSQTLNRTGIVRIHACGDTSGGGIDRCESNHEQPCVVEAGKIPGICQEANHFSGW
jgi:putative transposase